MKRQFHHIIFSLAFAAFCFGEVKAQDASFDEYESVDSEKDRLDREKILYSPGEGEVRYIPRNHAPSSVSATTPSSNTVKETSKESEVKVVNSNTTVKPKTDIPAKSAEKATTAQPKANGEGELPSFNFLYYIIQKYKLQDIID